MRQSNLRTNEARGIRFARCCAAALVLAASAVLPSHGVERSGKDVVETSCASCHGSGQAGAPRIGDRQAWAQRSQQGLAALTKTALAGIRNMPAHGGNMQLTDTEIARAVTYMVNQSGGRWTEPTSKRDPAVARSGREIVAARCANCHKAGVGGAPKIGDRNAWTKRLSPGLDATVRSAIHGHGAMPPRGGMADLTDAEVRSAILYMFNPDAGRK